MISRRIGERILIGDDVEILLAGADKQRADIAVKAPKNKTILRLPTLLEEQNVVEVELRKRNSKT